MFPSSTQPTTSGTSGLTPEQIAQNAATLAAFNAQNKPTAATTPAAVPTAAPKVSSPVVSSNTAASMINDKIIPTMNEAKTNLTLNQQNQNAATKAAFDAQQNKPAPAPKPMLTPEQEIAAQPDPGMQWVYDKTTGNKTQIAIGTAIPSTYTTVDVNSAPAVDTTTDSLGQITYKKLADGTYGRYDSSGAYTGPATQQTFDLMKFGQSQQKAYQDAIANGVNLKDEQKAQIQQIADTYKNMIEDEQLKTANLTGATAVLQNLRGMGNQQSSLVELKGISDKGLEKIKQLNTAMSSDISKLTSALKNDNLQELKAAYDSFSKNSADLQKTIDTQQSQAFQMEQAARQQAATAVTQVQNDIRASLDAAAKALAPPEVIEAMQKAAQNNDFAGVVKAGGDYLAGTTGIAGEYAVYKRDQQARGLPAASFDQYQTADANRKAKVAAAGATVMQGTNMNSKQQSVFNSLVANQNKSPLLMALDRAVILRDAIANVRANPSDGYVQQNLAYSYIQALDTYQSAVREGELKNVSNVDSAVGKIKNFSEKALNGQFARPEVALEMAKGAELIYNTIANAAQAKSNTFKAQAQINGLGSQWDEYTNLTKELNQTSTGAELNKNIDPNDPLGVVKKNTVKSGNNKFGI